MSDVDESGCSEASKGAAQSMFHSLSRMLPDGRIDFMLVWRDGGRDYGMSLAGVADCVTLRVWDTDAGQEICLDIYMLEQLQQAIELCLAQRVGGGKGGNEL